MNAPTRPDLLPVFQAAPDLPPLPARIPVAEIDPEWDQLLEDELDGL